MSVDAGAQSPTSPRPKDAQLTFDEWRIIKKGTDDAESPAYSGRGPRTLQKKKKTTEEKVTEVHKETQGVKPEIPLSPGAGEFNWDPSLFILEEGEVREMVHPRSKEDVKVKDLTQLLLGWLNRELSDQRILVKDLEEDLFDGQILGKLLEKLARIELQFPEVTGSEMEQRHKLTVVIDNINNILGASPLQREKWTPDLVHCKNLVAILHLLVAMAIYFRAPIRIPDNVVIEVIKVQKNKGHLQSATAKKHITTSSEAVSAKFERDAFDTLFDYAPDKLQLVRQSLVAFTNLHLNILNLAVTDDHSLEQQFSDGVYLVLLMGLLEDYFVPLYEFNITPTNFDEKVHNIKFSFELIQDAGLPPPKARAEDIVNGDLKSTLRVLYHLYNKFKQSPRT